MTDNAIPPCGPLRDRLVAEAVGWEWMKHVNIAWDAETADTRRPSTCDADALAALKAWKFRGTARTVAIEFNCDGSVWVELFEEDAFTCAHVSTLADAATAALVRWRNERSQS